MKVHDERIEARILHCTENLLFRDGLKGWNMDQLAVQAGLSKKTLYKIVGSKEKLLEKVVFNKIKSFQFTLKEIGENEADFSAALEKMICVYPSIYSFFSGKLREVYAEYPSIEEQMIHCRQELFFYLYDFFQSAQEAGKLRQDVDPETLLQILQGVVIQLVRHEQDSTQFSKKLNAAYNYVFHGVCT